VVPVPKVVNAVSIALVATLIIVRLGPRISYQVVMTARTKVLQDQGVVTDNFLQPVEECQAIGGATSEQCDTAISCCMGSSVQ
jgi:hypothetical protein